jgi:hypothetical protein
MTATVLQATKLSDISFIGAHSCGTKDGAEKHTFMARKLHFIGAGITVEPK